MQVKRIRAIEKPALHCVIGMSADCFFCKQFRTLRTEGKEASFCNLQYEIVVIEK